MKAAAVGAGDLLRMVRTGVDVNSIHAQAKRPFRIFLCGDPALVADLRATLLAGHGGEIPFEAGGVLETIVQGRPAIVTPEAKGVVFLGRPGDREGADFAPLLALKLPILAVTVDPAATPKAPPGPPGPGEVGEYTVTEINAQALRGYLFPHLVQICHGVEVAVARNLPALREFCAAKLTRDAAKRALTVAGASAVLDHVPLLGLVLGPIASAGDMVAITGIQMALMLQIGSCYGKDPDLGHVWELLPVVGGGFGWRALSRELAGFIPVAGVAIKAAIAYAGTIVVGEGVNFFYQHGRHMSAADAAKLYEETKASAMTFGRDVLKRIRGKS